MKGFMPCVGWGGGCKSCKRGNLRLISDTRHYNQVIAEGGWKSLWLGSQDRLPGRGVPLKCSKKMDGIWANGNCAMGKGLSMEKE